MKEIKCIKTGKVTSSECGSDCVCKEEVKSCDNCGYYDNLAYSEPCNTCTLGVTLKKVSFNWKPKVADEKPKVEKVKKYKYVCKSCDNIKCTVVNVRDIYPQRCAYGYMSKWKLKGEA
jgi:hypothetical protein